MRYSSAIPLAILGAAAFSTANAAAQQTVMHQADGFDASRAMLSDAPMFDPFHVSATQSLSEALEARLVEEGTPLLVVERAGRTLALLTFQMAYHHVAQGSIAGEPWMVAF